MWTSATVTAKRLKSRKPSEPSMRPSSAQARVQQPVLAEDRAPRVDADEVAREQRRRDQEQDGRLRPAGAVAQPVGDRQRDEHGDGGRAEPDVERVQGQRAVDAGGHDVLVVLERGGSADREEPGRQEAVDEERDERRDEEHEQADDGRQAQGNGPSLSSRSRQPASADLLVRDRGHVEPPRLPVYGSRRWP